MHANLRCPTYTGLHFIKLCDALKHYHPGHYDIVLCGWHCPAKRLKMEITSGDNLAYL